MQTHYRPLRLNVGFLLSQTAGYSRQFDFLEEELALGSDLRIKTFTGHLLLNRTPQGIITQGDFLATLPAECARCLKDFITSVPITFEELFVYPPQNATDPLLAIGEDAHLDLEPILREFLIVNQPTRPLCRKDCLGLCPICGNNLNEEECSHPTEVEISILLPSKIRVQETSVRKTTAGVARKKIADRRLIVKTVKKKAAVKKPATGGKKAPAVKAAVKKTKTTGRKQSATRRKGTGGKRITIAKRK